MFLDALSKKMTVIILSSLLATLFYIATPSVQADEPQPALWKLADDDSEIWLFGTVHILDPALRWRTDYINDAFGGADTLITEAPVPEADPETMQQLVIRHGINQNGESFLERLSPEGRNNFEKALSQLGMPTSAVHQFAPLRPWLAGVQIQVLQIQARGGSPDAGVDTVLWKEAKAEGKKLAYFETLEEQMQIFGTLPDAAELYFFEAGVRQMIEEPDLLDQLVASWQYGNASELATKMQEAMKGQDFLYDALLTNRNKKWAQQIKTLMDGSGKIFIAVGAAHLAGENSVQSMLKAYELYPVRQ